MMITWGGLDDGRRLCVDLMRDCGYVCGCGKGGI